MAGSSLLMLIDDIATLLDDVAVLTKVAATKTAGVLGDDLALNAQQVAGVTADRELPVVWAVAKGSLAQWAIIPFLMLGGAYLCFEGFEKLAHKFLHSKKEDQAHHRELLEAVAQPEIDLVAYENEKIKGAIRTDFVLSAEIIVITLGTVAAATFGQQVIVLIGIAIIMTIGVYGFVAGIVKLDDGGLHLSKKTGNGLWPRLQRRLGHGLLGFAPYLMRGLSIVGTAAMFMVGGGILVHGISRLHHFIESLTHRIENIPAIGGMLSALGPMLLNALIGVIAGAFVLLVVTVGSKAFRIAKA
jgi:uncharacterized protein